MRGRLPPSLPFASWPLRDQKAWLAANDGDPLAPGGAGPGVRWRETTRRLYQSGYCEWLGWLADRGELDPEAEPASRAKKSLVRLYLTEQEQAGLADYSRVGRLASLGSALQVISPDVDTAFIGRAAARIRAHSNRKNDLTPKMRPLRDVLDLGHHFMARADAGAGKNPVEQAVLFRDGMLIALWVLRPLRIANLGAIELGRSLRREGDGHRLEFAADQMKGHRLFTCAWPNSLEEALERYLVAYRPVLLAAKGAPKSSTALWISYRATGMKAPSVGQAIRIRTRRAFGTEMGPHIMRHIVGTAIAEEYPEYVTDVAAVLGHASLETSQRYYIHARGIRAIDQAQRAILARRGS